jgi:hypothetical protein
MVASGSWLSAILGHTFLKNGRQQPVGENTTTARDDLCRHGTLDCRTDGPRAPRPCRSSPIAAEAAFLSNRGGSG